MPPAKMFLEVFNRAQNPHEWNGPASLHERFKDVDFEVTYEDVWPSVTMRQEGIPLMEPMWSPDYAGFVKRFRDLHYDTNAKLIGHLQ
mgnify:CR=1 FL=1